MKNFIWILAALFLIAACGKDEPAEPVAEEEPAAVEEPAAEEAGEAAVEDEPEDIVEVVEETAAEPEPEEEAILLEKPEPPVAPVEWKYREGLHYTRIVPTQPTFGGADKIEVAEFFFYSCPHCDTFEPVIKRWAAEDKPANVRFVQIPATWNNILMLHARLFYTHEVLARNGVLADAAAFHASVYDEIHRRGNRLTTENSIRTLFQRHGVSPDDFDKVWKSFEVAQKVRLAQDLMRRYGVSSTPTIVVNGKYRTGAGEAGGHGKLLELIDELIVRESLR